MDSIVPEVWCCNRFKAWPTRRLSCNDRTFSCITLLMLMQATDLPNVFPWIRSRESQRNQRAFHVNQFYISLKEKRAQTLKPWCNMTCANVAHHMHRRWGNVTSQSESLFAHNDCYANEEHKVCSALQSEQCKWLLCKWGTQSLFCLAIWAMQAQIFDKPKIS